MTIRQYLNGRKRVCAGLFFVCVLIAMFIARHEMERTRSLSAPVMVVALACLILPQILPPMFIRCPRGKCRLGPVVMFHGAPWAIDSKFKHCPFCGVKLDEQI